jgi:hypothetical protein
VVRAYEWLVFQEAGQPAHTSRLNKKGGAQSGEDRSTWRHQLGQRHELGQDLGDIEVSRLLPLTERGSGANWLVYFSREMG